MFKRLSTQELAELTLSASSGEDGIAGLLDTRGTNGGEVMGGVGGWMDGLDGMSHDNTMERMRPQCIDGVFILELGMHLGLNGYLHYCT